MKNNFCTIQNFWTATNQILSRYDRVDLKRFLLSFSLLITSLQRCGFLKKLQSGVRHYETILKQFITGSCDPSQLGGRAPVKTATIRPTCPPLRVPAQNDHKRERVDHVGPTIALQRDRPVTVLHFLSIVFLA